MLSPERMHALGQAPARPVMTAREGAAPSTEHPEKHSAREVTCFGRPDRPETPRSELRERRAGAVKGPGDDNGSNFRPSPKKMWGPQRDTLAASRGEALPHFDPTPQGG